MQMEELVANVIQDGKYVMDYNKNPDIGENEVQNVADYPQRNY